MQIGTLHREFGHERSTLTSILDRLERRKLIRRELNPTIAAPSLSISPPQERAPPAGSRMRPTNLSGPSVARWTPTSCAASKLSRKQSRLQFETTLRLRT